MSVTGILYASGLPRSGRLVAKPPGSIYDRAIYGDLITYHAQTVCLTHVRHCATSVISVWEVRDWEILHISDV